MSLFGDRLIPSKKSAGTFWESAYHVCLAMSLSAKWEGRFVVKEEGEKPLMELK